MFAQDPQPREAPLLVRLIGDLDQELVEAFATLERSLVGRDGRTLIVHAGDAAPTSEREVGALMAAVRAARAAGRDVRVDAGTSLAWRRRFTRVHCEAPLDPGLRRAAGRTVILAHSVRNTRSRRR